MPPFRSFIPGDWGHLELIIRELFARVNTEETSFTEILSDIAVNVSDIALGNVSDVVTNASDILILKSDVAVLESKIYYDADYGMAILVS